MMDHLLKITILKLCIQPAITLRITSPDQLVPAITDALASDEPVFIDVPTRSELEEVPPVHAWQQALQRGGFD